MTDFFDTLAERAVASTPTVVPRRPARFESPADVVAEATASEPAASMPVADVHPAAAVTPSRLTIDVQPDDLPTAPPPRRSSHPIPPLDPMPTARNEPSDAPRRLTPVIDAPLHAMTREPTPDAPALVERPATREPRSEPPVAIVERQTVVVASTVIQPTARTEPAASPPPRSASPVIMPTVERLVAAAPNVMERSPEAVSTRMEPPAPPRIEVTIGTVEVRAVLPAPTVTATRPAPEPPPAVSLHKYLEQRRRS